MGALRVALVEVGEASSRAEPPNRGSDRISSGRAWVDHVVDPERGAEALDARRLGGLPRKNCRWSRRSTGRTAPWSASTGRTSGCSGKLPCAGRRQRSTTRGPNGAQATRRDRVRRRASGGELLGGSETGAEQRRREHQRDDGGRVRAACDRRGGARGVCAAAVQFASTGLLLHEGRGPQRCQAAHQRPTPLDGATADLPHRAAAFGSACRCRTFQDGVRATRLVRCACPGSPASYADEALGPQETASGEPPRKTRTARSRARACPREQAHRRLTGALADVGLYATRATSPRRATPRVSAFVALNDRARPSHQHRPSRSRPRHRDRRLAVVKPLEPREELENPHSRRPRRGDNRGSSGGQGPDEGPIGRRGSWRRSVSCAAAAAPADSRSRRRTPSRVG